MSVGQRVCACVCLYACVMLSWSVKVSGVKAGVDILVVAVITAAAEVLGFFSTQQEFIQR